MNVSSANLPQALQEQRQAEVPSGYLIEQVRWISKAHWYDLQPGDIVTRYDGNIVWDKKSYRAALDRGLGAGKTEVELTLMRAGQPRQLNVPSGLIGVKGSDWTFVRDKIIDLVREHRITEAEQLLAKAEAKQDLSREDLLITRIHFIPDSDSSSEALRKKMMMELASIQNRDEIVDVSFRIFSTSKQFHAAALILERALKTDPNDIAIGNNLALTYAMLGRFDDAERITNQRMKLSRHELTPFGWSVVHKTKGYVYEGRGVTTEAINFFRQAIEESRDVSDLDLRLHYLLNVAKLDDWKTFELCVDFCNRNSGDDFREQPYYVDALRAHLLTILGRRGEAEQTVRKWRNNTEAQRRVIEYWSSIPVGEAIASDWDRLVSVP